ncbi:MAG: hypothetical protein KC413_11300, partial [Anaerolineales bacterium]|nr:hypothetical protein [Anaerolineales bacterium]
RDIALAPATYVAIAVVGLGLAAWWWRDHLTGLAKDLRGLAQFAANGFGFETVNRVVVNLTQRAASALQLTQTGDLNWNVVGIVGALLLVLLVLAG